MATETTLDILLVEDSPTDVLLTEEALSQPGRFRVRSTERLAEALRLLSIGHLDVVLLDLGLPDSQELDTLRTLRHKNPKVAVIVLTGKDDEELALRALQEGAEDYLVKGQVDAGQLRRAIRYALERRASIDALQESKQSLERAVAELQAKNHEIRGMTQQLWQAAKLASVGELAASIAHELNNPLATVRLRIESMQARTPVDDPRRRTLEIIEQETKRMGDLVANLLQFSRRGDEKTSTVDICDELTKAVELIHHYLRSRQVTVQQELAQDTPIIFADRQKLRQVFLNLLTNAGDAMTQGGTLTLRSAPATLDNGLPAVQIEFIDSGTGIPSAIVKRVFDPFFTTKEEGKGTGLGLAICRRAVEDHQGTIRILSEVGKGTTVHIKLPVKVGSNVEGLHTGTPTR